MPVTLQGKPIVIAGASSGIGAATALACAAAGMPVALGARRLDRLESLAEECRNLGVTAAAIACDVTDPDACARLIEQAESQLGPAHAVFANAGIGHRSPLLGMSDTDTRELFETNFFGTLNVVCPAAERMMQRRSGHILICSSCLSLLPTPNYSVYSATKAAQHHTGRALDIELRAHNIRCSTVHPIGTATEFFDQTKGTQNRSKRFQQPPERVARAIVRCLKRPKPEVWTSAMARYAVLAGAFTPRLTGRLLRPR